MVNQTFSTNNAWSIDPPCFVRKVDRSGHWKDAATIQEKVFRPEPEYNTISVYLINSASDLARVAVALNANRSSKTEPIFLVAITGDELTDIVVRRTAGMTLCKWANHLHHDLVAADNSRLSELSQTLVAAGRRPRKFTKKDMQEALDTSTNDGCHAANADSDGCVCADELSKTRSPSWFSRIGQVLARTIGWLFGGTAGSKH
jgi:hypothetical protein